LTYQIEFLDDAFKDLKKLGKPAQKRILKYLKERVSNCENPRDFGKPLKGSLYNLWRYRVDKYRIICRIEDDRLCVLVVRIAHRSKSYN